MKLLSLSIRNYRSIQKLDWEPNAPFVCVLGKGDVGKSTILDAIEAVLSSKRAQFFDTDFHNCNVNVPIEISATVRELSSEALEEGRMGMHLQGLSTQGKINDEPQKDDEAIVTVKLTVDKDLDPRWELITARLPPKAIYSKDRTLFGVVRLGAETDTHLTWGQYSHLARLSEQKGSASNALTTAFRTAKETVKTTPMFELNKAAEEVRKEAIRLGAYGGASFEAGLDTQRLLSSLSGLTLHSVDIPLRMSGLGSRRLTALAVQRLSVPDGAIVLIDELEHGLEPHRIRHAIKLLKDEVHAEGLGQVILTTHSSTTIVELTTANLGITLRTSEGVRVIQPSANLQAKLRGDPEVFLSSRVVVSEGKTEIGILRALRKLWASRHNDEPLAYRGVGLTDGSGSSGPQVAKHLAELGYPTCLFRDSDIPLTTAETSDLKSLNVEVIEWSGKRSTEQQIFSEISLSGIQSLLDFVYEEFGEAQPLEALALALGTQNLSSNKCVDWITPALPEATLRAAIAEVAQSYKKNSKAPADRVGWFKRIDRGEKLGEVVEAEIKSGLSSSLTQTLDKVEAWSYGG